MDNDFIKGMETFVRCKKYAEARLKVLYGMLEKDRCRNSEFIKKEIDRLRYVLGIAEETV